VETTLERARAAKQKAWLLYPSFGDVNGIGIVRTDTGWGLEVNFTSPPQSGFDIPREVDGVSVSLQVSGPPEFAAGEDKK
jgi:hypothetical protein